MTIETRKKANRWSFFRSYYESFSQNVRLGFFVCMETVQTSAQHGDVAGSRKFQPVKIAPDSVKTGLVQSPLGQEVNGGQVKQPLHHGWEISSPASSSPLALLHCRDRLTRQRPEIQVTDSILNLRSVGPLTTKSPISHQS